MSLPISQSDIFGKERFGLRAIMPDLLVERLLKKSRRTLKASEHRDSAYIPALKDGGLRTF